eukprot:TRINITY_DN8902_c0_g1_i2.p3 TRINITY_DN8902_c0_g1~~TRINITY_DN8902_c0_g1_i2.p3  ORF type:complete len:116 (-),score=15.38 TRINITY_DN8902_c0_g1_i2:218-523(-)
MGVEVETSLEGDGQTYPKPGDTVRMHYTARLATTGQKIDSTHDRRAAAVELLDKFITTVKDDVWNEFKHGASCFGFRLASIRSSGAGTRVCKRYRRASRRL